MNCHVILTNITSHCMNIVANLAASSLTEEKKLKMI